MTKTACYDDLCRRILLTELEPGAELDETRLADHYRISRTPLREVLQRLAGDGYVRIEANRGTKVASMDVATMRTFFQTAPLIYATISRLAAENHAADQLTTLKEIQTGFTRATVSDDATDAAFANHRFHRTIGEMAHNSYLTAALERLLIDHTRMSQTFYRPASSAEKALIRKAAEQHDAMIEAIEARAPAIATDLALEHWDLSRDRLERYVRPDPLPMDFVSLTERRDAV